MEISIHPKLLMHLEINAAKRTMLRRDCNDLDTIVLGSSHGDYSFNPKYFPSSFNLCCTSQDLHHSFLLYRYVVTNYPNIKSVVLYYSIFSPSWNMLRSESEKYISVSLNELFSLGIEYYDEELKSEYNKIRGRLSKLIVDSNGYRGFTFDEGKTYFSDSYGADVRANEHLQFNKLKEENLFLIKILLFAKHLKHKLYVVVPPVRSDYKKALGGNFNSLFSSLIEIIYDFNHDYKIELINEFDSNLFHDSYFGDYDHLLPSGSGAEILTKIIYERTI